MITMFTRKPWLFHGALACLLVVAAFVSGMYGQISLTAAEFLRALLGRGDEGLVLIVQDLRMPRVALAILTGATLGYTGAALQGLLRNPLADPGVIGVTSSASLGAVIAIYFGFSAVSLFMVPVFAMTGALFATFVLVILAARDSSVLTLILAGMGISSLAMAGVSLVMNFAPTPMSVQEMVLWMLGSLENRTYEDLILASPFILAGWVMMLGSGQGLNALSLGSEAAATLGIDVARLRWRIVMGTALSVGATVAVCGSVGFIGLVVPHFVRAVIGYEPRKILLPSAFVGAFIMLLADILTRLPIGHGQLRLGVVTALIGAPMFIYIVFKTRESMR
ncbi:FecCD family ABC transporter permease [Kordiimonas pumila]|uniref:FecCD family ABC transporter permease n=1 Tax=Kordiimonas pumila TaxID=2161677 RepID=A0ABV7D743_9PROT|nr:iron ABC transporter permease [Kordiimonas pumila]